MPNANDVQRFDEALATLLALAAADMDLYKGYEGVLEWLAQQPDAQQAKSTVGAQLSLGYHFRKSAAITQFRETLRAYLLVLITRFALSGDTLKTAKATEPGASPDITRRVVIASLKRYCQRIVVRHGGIVIDPNVYKWAGVKHFPRIALELRDARDRGAEILRKAFAYTKRSDDPDGYYRRWFGTANRAGIASELQNLIEMYHHKPIRIKAEEQGQGLKTVYGSATKQYFEYAKDAKYIEVNLGDHFFGGTARHSSQIVHDRAMYDEILERHIALKKRKEEALEKLRQDIIGGGDEAVLDRAHGILDADLDRQIRENAARVPPTDRGVEKISVTGVILHEVTHNAIATTDVEMSGQPMYGPNMCLWLASNHPNKVASNADNWRLYCEEFLEV